MKGMFKGLMLAGMLGAYGAYAGGFSILEQSASGLGRSLAGITADTSDPASMYFNAATPAWFDRTQVMSGTHMMHVNAFFKNKHSSPELGRDESGNMGGWVYIPNLYMVHPISGTVSLGFGLSATSGTRTEYNPHWIGRYNAIETEIAVTEMNAVLSWKIREDLSVGAGIVGQYAKCEMSQAMNLSAFGMSDGKLKLKGDSFAVGFTAGVLYEPIEGTRIGLGYRSRMKQDLDLEANTHRAGDAAALYNSIYHPAESWRTKDDAKAELKLPSMVNFGIEQALSSRWKVMMDISWTEWSQMDQLAVKFDNNIMGKKVSAVNMKWKDNWRVALGTTYDLNEKYRLSFGVAFDETPIQDEYRNSRLPDSERYWVSAGLRYKYSENMHIDFGYFHLFLPTNSFKEVDSSSEGTGSARYVKGKARGSVDCFSMAVTYKF